MIEADHIRSVRVQAPLATVWAELDPLERLLRQIPEVAYVRLEPGGRSGEISTRLGWGPMQWKFAEVTVTESTPPQHLAWRAQAKALQLDFEGIFDLGPAPNGYETVLTYRGALRCRHKLVGRLRGAMAAYLEGHVNSVADRVAAMAAQHEEADSRLRRPDPGTAP